MPQYPPSCIFHFYTTDQDRSVGYNKHTSGLDLAFVGFGSNPQAALEEAAGAMREDYYLFASFDPSVDGSPQTEHLVAIRLDHHRALAHTYHEPPEELAPWAASTTG